MESHRTGGCAAEVVHREGHAVVVVRGEIDIATADQFRCAVELASRQGRRIEVDLRHTTFMDAAGLAVLLRAYRRLGRAHEAIVIHDPPPLILTLFEITGVAALFDIRVDIDADDALKVFAACEHSRGVGRAPGVGISRSRFADGPTHHHAAGGRMNARSSYDEEEAVS